MAAFGYGFASARRCLPAEPAAGAGQPAVPGRRTASGAAASRVRETAAAAGIVTRALRDSLASNAPMTPTGLDPDMLAVARTKFGAGQEVARHQAQATAQRFPDRSFDPSVCRFGVMFENANDAGDRHAYQVLTTGRQGNCTCLKPTMLKHGCGNDMICQEPSFQRNPDRRASACN
ncbi:class I SAM-dependent methyltransferase [Rhodopila sp.]|uniref:class I SAM-dependent methyltransferase n=1 Tax=Rhodopila sp. TaxID=2480087 RepID=UPI003D0FEDA3